VNANTFKFVSELNLEWWKLIHEKKHVNTCRERVLSTITNSEEVMKKITSQCPELYEYNIYSEYITHQKQNLDKSIADKTTKTKTNKI